MRVGLLDMSNEFLSVEYVETVTLNSDRPCKFKHSFRSCGCILFFNQKNVAWGRRPL